MQLLHEQQRKALAARIKSEIDDFCRVAYSDGHRSHLGASLIGHECERYLWYTFRWVEDTDFSGRMRRLFNRGHETEPRFVHWLRGIGFEVWDVDPNTNEQFRIYGCGGHFGGGLDGIIRTPVSYQLTDPLLLEMKTSKTGKPWTELNRDGVKTAKPRHYDQMCSYGSYYGFKYALYMCINKDDDDLYIEIVELDWNKGRELIERKSERVITSQVPPPRLNESPAYFKCKVCDKLDVCHKGAHYERNCRACDNAQPIENGQWWCRHWGQIIPNREAILAACPVFTEVGRRRK